MATKKSLAEQCLLLLGHRSADSKIDIRELILSVEQVLANVVRVRYFESRTDSEQSIDGTLTNVFKNVPVSWDSDLCTSYLDLPAKVIDLPHGIGIRHIAPSKEPKATGYTEVVPGFNELFENLHARALHNRTPFYREGNRIIFPNMDKSQKPDYMNVKLILGISSLGVNDELSIPPDMELIVIQSVVQMFAPEPPQDIVNDNVDQP
jgi:hypothetical protein